MKKREEELDKLIVLAGLQGFPLLTVTKASTVRNVILISKEGALTKEKIEKDAQSLIKLLYGYLPALTLMRFLKILEEKHDYKSKRD